MEAVSTNAAIQLLWQGMPNTPGKAQEIVGVKVIQTVSCTQAGAPARGPRGTMALRTILLTGLRIPIARPFHEANPARLLVQVIVTHGTCPVRRLTGKRN